MTDARWMLTRVFDRVAPDVDLDDVDPDAPLQDALVLDSLDFLNLVAALTEEAGIDVPGRDYPRLSSVNGFLAYIAARLDPGSPVADL